MDCDAVVGLCDVFVDSLPGTSEVRGQDSVGLFDIGPGMSTLPHSGSVPTVLVNCRATVISIGAVLLGGLSGM